LLDESRHALDFTPFSVDRLRLVFLPSVRTAVHAEARYDRGSVTYNIVNVVFSQISTTFGLPVFTMLAWYMLSSYVRPSVHLSACLSQAGTVPKLLNAGCCKQRHMIAQEL